MLHNIRVDVPKPLNGADVLGGGLFWIGFLVHQTLCARAFGARTRTKELQKLKRSCMLEQHPKMRKPKAAKP